MIGTRRLSVPWDAEETATPARQATAERVAVWRSSEGLTQVAVAAGRDGVYLFTEVAALRVAREQDLLDDSCLYAGSVVECESQALGETVAIAGTPYALAYSSARAPAREWLEIPLGDAAGGGEPDSGALAHRVVVEVAGRTFTHLAAAGESRLSFVWDGRDAAGKVPLGPVPITVEVEPLGPDGRSSGPPALWQSQVGRYDSRALGLGGWTLSAVHYLDAATPRLWLGSGERRSGRELGQLTVDEMSGYRQVATDGGSSSSRGAGRAPHPLSAQRAVRRLTARCREVVRDILERRHRRHRRHAHGCRACVRRIHCARRIGGVALAVMASQTHEALLLLFRNRPALAPELLRDALHVPLPEFTEARIESAELSQIQPAEYRADLVVLLYENVPVLGIVVEVQLRPDDDKRFSWPAYVANLRARIRCPVCLLVVTAEDAVARWAARPIELGGESRLVPLVLGPSGVPEVTDEEAARRDPELAVLSAMAHGRDADTERAVRIALSAMAASVGLDAERSTLYFDLTMASLGEAAREALQGMDPSKYEYQSEFARTYFSQGKAEGEAEGKAEGEVKGKAEIVLRLLSLRFGPLTERALARVRGATAADLDRFAERVLTAASVDEVLGAD